MALKQRAMGAEDKEERRQAILDAAGKLFVKHPDRMASVSEVAEAAGLAKGTVYLYFPSKEEMLLALHERHVAGFFAQLMTLLDSDAPAGFDEIVQVAVRHIVRVPGYLALTSRCFGLMDRDMPVEAAMAFKVRVGQILVVAGQGLERRYPQLKPGDGVTLLQHSYGLIVGLWQLLHPIERFSREMQRRELQIFNRDYEREVESALRALWTGVMARPADAKPAERKRI